MGYLPYGDLLGYLRKNGRYSNSYNTGEKKPASKLTAKDHLSFAWMIADGMQYLATIKVICNNSLLKVLLLKSESMGAPGRRATCYLSDFDETWPV